MMSKGYKAISVLTVLLFSYVATMAQGVPCSGDIDDPGYDPNGCNAPLDTWVIVLVIAALFLGYRHIQKQKISFS